MSRITLSIPGIVALHTGIARKGWSCATPRWLWSLASLLVLGCVQQVKLDDAGDDDADLFRGKVVLVLPLAVSGELGDERTGIVLTDQARFSASAVSCEHLARRTREVRIVCVNAELSKSEPSVVDLETQFALGKALKEETLSAVQRRFQADFVLLFRPEGVNSSREVVRLRPLIPSEGGSQNDIYACSTNTCGATRHSTETTYVVSSELVELRSGTILKRSERAESAERTVGRNLGHGESAPVEPLLEKVMSELAESMLEL